MYYLKTKSLIRVIKKEQGNKSIKYIWSQNDLSIFQSLSYLDLTQHRHSEP